MAELDLTQIAAASISTPAAGVTAVYDELTSPAKRLSTKDDAGTVINYIGINTTDTGANRLQNKDIDVTNCSFVDGTDTTKEIDFQTSAASTATTLTIADNQTTSQTASIPNIAGADTFVLQTTAAQGANRLVSKDLEAGTTKIVDSADTTKKIGWIASAASTATTLTIADNQSTSQTLNIPNITAADTVVTTGLAQSITGVKTMTNMTTLAGTTAVPSMTITNGTNLTSAAANAIENDGINMYLTTNTTDGRAAIPARQHFRLTANGSNVTTIANFFGANSNISLVANAYYDIEIICFFTKTTTEVLTWTFTNSSAPTSQQIIWEQSPITGIVAPPGTATLLSGQFINDATAARTIAAGSLTTAVNHYMKCRILLKNGTGTSLKIQASNPAGSITPLLGSQWTALRFPTGNTGNFQA